MSHWYLSTNDGRGELFTPEHKMWGQLPGWPRIKSGAPAKRLNDRKRLEMGLYPSVTTVLDFIAPKGKVDGLIEWGAKLALEAALEAGPQDDVLKLARAKRKEDANRGTELHKAIEIYLATGVLPEKDAVAARACTAVDEHITGLGIEGRKEWAFCAEEVPDPNIQHGPWMKWAGTIDFLGIAGPAGESAVIDFKTVRDDDGRRPRDTELPQVAAYAFGAYGKPATVAQNVYISRTSGEIVNAEDWTVDEQEEGWRVFCAAYNVMELLV